MRPNSVTSLSILPADVRAATANGADYDVAVYDGHALAILDAEAQGSGITSTVKLQSSSLAAGAKYDTLGATDIPLRTGASDNVLIAAKFTQTGVRQLKKVTLPLKAIGTLGSGDVWVTILADSSGPTGSALVTSAKISAASILTTYQNYTFEFATALEVADNTVYHIVLQGDYTASSSNQIKWRALTVGSGGNAFIYDSSWAADALSNFEFAIQQLTFTDITGAAFTGVGNTASHQRLWVDISAAGKYLRCVDTVAGGSATGALGVVLVVNPKYI